MHVGNCINFEALYPLAHTENRYYLDVRWSHFYVSRFLELYYVVTFNVAPIRPNQSRESLYQLGMATQPY
jgi:hypothetical protein